MRLLILGSEGFIGSNLISFFLNKGVRIAGCDLFERPSQHKYEYFKVSRLSPEWDDIFSRKFDFCINAAGSGNVPYSMEHPLIDFESNTLDTMRILDAIRKNNESCRYLHISSAAVYGNPVTLPVRETDAANPISAYGWHKLMSEQICLEYSSIYKLRVAIIRPFSLYGNGLKKQLLWDISQKLRTSDKIQLFGTGKESRDFIHCNDLVRLIECLTSKGDFNGEVYNVGSGVETTIGTVARLIEQSFNGSKTISFSGLLRPGDPLNWCADISIIRSLGYLPLVKLDDGIRDYVTWFGNVKPIT